MTIRELQVMCQSMAYRLQDCVASHSDQHRITMERKWFMRFSKLLSTLNLKSPGTVGAKAGLCSSLLLLSSAVYAGNQGTEFNVQDSATTKQTQTDSYTWSLQKTLKPSQVPYIIRQGMTVNVEYLLTADRSGPSTVYTNTPVSGQICVNNTGSQPTVGLWMTATLQQSLDGGTTWTNFSGPVVVPGTEVPGNTNQCFPYQFTNTLAGPPAQYRTYVTASADNFIGFEGTQHTISATDPVVVIPNLVEIDKTATLVDTFTCPSGFSCTPLQSTIPLTESYPTTVYAVSLTNDSAECGNTVEGLNTAVLTPSTNSALPPASASASIYTGTCNQLDRKRK